MLITVNQPFGEWGKIFSDQAMTLAAIDRLVHHATILEKNVDIAGKLRSNASVAQVIETVQPVGRCRCWRRLLPSHGQDPSRTHSRVQALNGRP